MAARECATFMARSFRGGVDVERRRRPRGPLRLAAAICRARASAKVAALLELEHRRAVWVVRSLAPRAAAAAAGATARGAGHRPGLKATVVNIDPVRPLSC